MGETAELGALPWRGDPTLECPLGGLRKLDLLHRRLLQPAPDHRPCPPFLRAAAEEAEPRDRESPPQVSLGDWRGLL